MRREALRAAVAARVADGALRVVESVTSDGKTKALVATLSALGVAGEPTLLVTAAMAERSRAPRATCRGSSWSRRLTSHLSAPRARHVVFERAALTALERR